MDSAKSFFAGPGLMRGLCRGLDWAATSLGRVDTWSAALRSTMQFCLDSPGPTLVAWGPDLVTVYNDSFAPQLGDQHPRALGLAARQCPLHLSGRITIGLDAPADLAVSSRPDEQLILVQDNCPEESYFSFSGTPIRDGDGAVLGHVMTSSETTAQVLGKRQMEVVRDVGAVPVLQGRTTGETCAAVVDVLAQHRETAPFAMVYLRGDGQRWDRVAQYGMVPDSVQATGDALFEGVIDLVVRTGRGALEGGLRRRMDGLLLAGPIGPLTPDQALVLPLTPRGQVGPAGALVVGVNPYRPLDEQSDLFLSLLMRQVRVVIVDTATFQSDGEQSWSLPDQRSVPSIEKTGRQPANSGHPLSGTRVTVDHDPC
ncbi:hypothetical protein ACVBEQ_02730 [Nakamurella sp. GG22]